jgi:TIR domain
MYDLSPELEPLFFRMQVIIGGKAALRWQTNMAADKSILSVFVLNFIDGIKHRVFIVPRLSIPDLRGILISTDAISQELAKVEMQLTKHLDIDTPTESSDDLPISNRMFFFTDTLEGSREEFRTVLASTKYVGAIIDDVEWKRRLEMRKPDAFIAHDSRDKTSLARPLAIALSKMGLIVWYDEFSLKPGDRLSESIDKGLTECRHAVLLVSKNLLENTTWANTEMSALLTRAIADANSLIPIWADVDAKAVAARSARLADIVAINHSGNVEELASRIYATVGGAEGALR